MIEAFSSFSRTFKPSIIVMIIGAEKPRGATAPTCPPPADALEPTLSYFTK